MDKEPSEKIANHLDTVGLLYASIFDLRTAVGSVAVYLDEVKLDEANESLQNAYMLLNTILDFYEWILENIEETSEKRHMDAVLKIVIINITPILEFINQKLTKEEKLTGEMLNEILQNCEKSWKILKYVEKEISNSIRIRAN